MISHVSILSLNLQRIEELTVAHHRPYIPHIDGSHIDQVVQLRETGMLSAATPATVARDMPGAITVSNPIGVVAVPYGYNSPRCRWNMVVEAFQPGCSYPTTLVLSGITDLLEAVIYTVGSVPSDPETILIVNNIEVRSSPNNTLANGVASDMTTYDQSYGAGALQTLDPSYVATTMMESKLLDFLGDDVLADTESITTAITTAEPVVTSRALQDPAGYMAAAIQAGATIASSPGVEDFGPDESKQFSSLVGGSGWNSNPFISFLLNNKATGVTGGSFTIKSLLDIDASVEQRITMNNIPPTPLEEQVEMDSAGSDYRLMNPGTYDDTEQVAATAVTIIRAIMSDYGVTFLEIKELYSGGSADQSYAIVSSAVVPNMVVTPAEKGMLETAIITRLLPAITEQGRLAVYITAKIDIHTEAVISVALDGSQYLSVYPFPSVLDGLSSPLVTTRPDDPASMAESLMAVQQAIIGV